ncbi:hypothetical protein GQ457_17G003450 [Hibiscus cannabinus]
MTDVIFCDELHYSFPWKQQWRHSKGLNRNAAPATRLYLVDKLTADNRIFHKSCFRCHHCRGTLKLSNFNSFEGVLYCRPHYDQLFKRTGSLDKSFEGTPKIVKPERQMDNENAIKVSNMFEGTREKCKCCNKTAYPIERLSNFNSFEGVLYCRPHYDQLFKRTGSLDKSFEVSNMFEGTREKCKCCNKTAYPIERVTVNRTIYHKSCFKCIHGGCTISPSNYIAHEGKLYCKHHHIQLFREKGNYSQLETNDHAPITDNVASMEIANES